MRALKPIRQQKSSTAMLTTTTQSPALQDQQRYDAVTIGLHWLTVLLVLALFLLAKVWEALPHGTPLRHGLQGLHISLGILLSAIIAARIVWRARFGRSLSAVRSSLPYWAARSVHHVLYALISGQVVFGYLFRWAQGEAFNFFGLFAIPALFSPDRSFARVAGEIHELAGWAIIILACGHGAAALFHHYVLRDDTLRRMSPIRSGR